MIESVRARLTLWYTGVFAIFLTLFAVSAYEFLERTTLARVDEYLAETSDAIAGAIEAASDDPRTREELVDIVLRDYRFRDFGVGIYDARTGQLVASSPALGRRRLQSGTDVLARGDFPALPADAPRDEEHYMTLRGPDGGVRIFTEPVAARGGPLLVATSRSLRGHARTLREVRDAIAVGLPLALLLAAIGGYFFVRQTLQPVVAMSDQAARIGASTLHERLPLPRKRDELGRLASVFNELLGRLDTSFARQRQFMADASHELRTPVAIVSGEAELALARPDRDADQLREALARVHDQARRMRRIVDDLFLLARADAGEQPLVRSPLYLDELVEECTQSMRTIAEGKRIALAFDGGAELPLDGDESLLRRLVTNLVDNAIKYTPAGGCVTVRAAREDGRYVIAVTDTGRGIPAEAQPYIFDRFYRVDHSDHAAVDGERGSGAGLGLAIARWIAEAHGGTLRLVRSDATGSEFRIELRGEGEGAGAGAGRSAGG